MIWENDDDDDDDDVDDGLCRWNKAHDLMLELKMHKDIIPKLVEESKICFRCHCWWW